MSRSSDEKKGKRARGLRRSNVRKTVDTTIETAQEFAAEHSRSGYTLDFSLASFETEVDRLLETPLFLRGREGVETREQERNLAGLVAYVGETLRLAFDGELGDGFESRGDNWYTGLVQFGDHKYWPGEGTFLRHLKGILPGIQKAATTTIGADSE